MMNPASAGFFPASQEEKAMRAEAMIIFNSTGML
jgi:hypothetical protein